MLESASDEALPEKDFLEKKVTATERTVRRPEEAAASDPFFIPLGWPHLREGKFYSSSDPEWREFVRISRDGRKLESLKDDLATIALRNASASNILLQLLGGPLTITGFWLVHHFPSRAPPEYALPGLEIADTEISWAVRPVSSDTGDCIRKCMKPLFVALAARDAYLVLMKRQLSRMGFQVSDKIQSGTDSLVMPPSGTVFTGLIDGSAGHHKTGSQLSFADEPHGRVTQQNHPWLNPSSVLSSLQWLPLPNLGPESDLRAAAVAFKWRLNDCWARELRTPRRGTFFIVGPVGLKGPKGFCRVDVRGEYDPLTSRWTHVSMQLKDLNIFKQRALGSR
ncbi:hypothetical protein ALT_9372 [Aspergillus lentulus]|uniref:Uncharacterized protein n=1 Tax=Aspergillus lentulus TaxID=293939 RepID=A0AAN5YPY4_ASPLE|nr:hypothetical protein CNMCM6069_008217 [Aspergillus lentulus]KAF4161912.1 hypothetical protein CNMCM6936_002861 [Aspergillus lentulus]KAF4182683.1 hypothetical protein CNMCM8060_006047 [Aspergillus lentulus]KAF4187759.1 hypothetical protein CNMCM7927_003248 [Aspergillus lentulus]KAF4190949.1 hypothetical protein CNMCM8694_002640 [Aspergillus lentulus]